MKKIFLLASLITACLAAHAETVGEVSTTFRWIGANNKIVVDVFDDPKIDGISCYLSHATTGGIKGTFGFAEDTSDASVACRQVSQISFKAAIGQQEEVFSEKSSFLFKHLRVVRIWDKERRTFAYMAYSDKLVDGSPKNSVSAVPVPSNINVPVK